MLYYIRDWCNESEPNNTLIRHDHDYVQTEKFNSLIIFPIAAVALIANSLSLFIFAKQKFDNRAVRFSLLSISCTEICLQCILLVETCIVRSNFEHWHTVLSYTVTTCVHIGINTLMSIRNWNVLLISSARCEVITRPLASRRFLLFSRSRLSGMFCAVIVAALLLAVLNNLTHMGALCTNMPDTVVIRPLMNPAGAQWAVYTFQSLIPTVLIPIPTVIMWVRIRRSRPVKRCGPSCRQNVGRSQQKRTLSSRRASQMVLGLAILFSVLEFPTFVSTTLLSLSPTLLDTLPIHPDTITNVLSVTDSLLNFFVYSASSAKFRSDVYRLAARPLVCRVCRRAAEAAAAGADAAADMTSGADSQAMETVHLKCLYSNNGGGDCASAGGSGDAAAAFGSLQQLEGRSQKLTKSHDSLYD